MKNDRMVLMQIGTQVGAAKTDLVGCMFVVAMLQNIMVSGITGSAGGQTAQ